MTAPHPKISERRAEVEDQTQRSRQRKLIAIAAIVVLGLLAAASTQSSLLDVDEIRVVGATRTSTEYLRAAAGLELGTPVLGLDTDEIEERLLALPEVETVTASSNWSGVVTIEIIERLPVARIESVDGTVVVAADGLVLRVIDREPAAPDSVDDLDLDDLDLEETELEEIELEPLPADVAALPEIAGAMFRTERGKVIPTVLDDALLVAASLPNDIASITERVEITVDSLVLTTAGGGAISLGDARDLDLKFDAIRAFLAQVDLSCLDTLNVRAPSVPVIRRSASC